MQSDLSFHTDRNLTIAELGRQCGVSLRALRFYEQMGLVTPQRLGTRRFYTSKDKVRVELILTGKRLGFSLREIGRMLQSHQARDEPETVELVETLDLATIEQQLGSLQRQRADLDEAITELRTMLMTSSSTTKS